MIIAYNVNRCGKISTEFFIIFFITVVDFIYRAGFSHISHREDNVLMSYLGLIRTSIRRPYNVRVILRVKQESNCAWAALQEDVETTFTQRRLPPVVEKVLIRMR